jgi:hypothetical protein
MRSLWERGLRTWPYLVASLAFVISTGFATQYGMEHRSVQRSADAVELAATPVAAEQTVFMSPARVRHAFSEMIASVNSVRAVFWPLMTLLVLLLTLRLGAAIAGIGYDCGRMLIWATALVITGLHVPGVA